MSAAPGLSLADFPGDVLTVEQAAQVLNIGRAAAYRAIHTGDLPTIKIGRTVRVPKRALE